MEVSDQFEQDSIDNQKLFSTHFTNLNNDIQKIQSKFNNFENNIMRFKDSPKSDKINEDIMVKI